VLGATLIGAAAVAGCVWLGVTRATVQFTWASLWRAVRPSLVVAIVTGLPPAAVYFGFGARPDAVGLPLALGASCGVLFFLAALRLTGHPMGSEIVLMLRTIAATSARILGLGRRG